MDELKREEIRGLLLQEWDNYPDKIALANKVMNGYIFGQYAHSEHYTVQEILSIVNEIEKEKTIETQTESETERSHEIRI